VSLLDNDAPPLAMQLRSQPSPAGRSKRPPAVSKWFARTNKWIKVVPTGRRKWTTEAGSMHSQPICGREMRSGGQRPRWLAVRACLSLARKSVNQKRVTVALHKKLPATISLQATATLSYPYSPPLHRRPHPSVAYIRSSPQPRSTVLEPSPPAWLAR
jgi:uncharacterized protein (DUF2235 family)